MAVQNPHLTTDGDLNQAKRKRAGEVVAIDAVPKQTSFDITNTPTPGNPGRAAQMQAQFDQPVTIGGTKAAPSPDSAGIGRMVGGSLSIAPAAVWEGAKNLGADFMNVGRSIIDAEQQPRPGYQRTAALAQEISDGAGAFSDANSNLVRDAKAGARDAIGAKPAMHLNSVMEKPESQSQPSPSNPYIGNDFDQWSKNQPVQVAASPSAVSSQPVTTTPAANQPAGSQFYGTNIGQDAQGGQIAVRRGESGVPEFSNDPTAQADAQAVPAAGMGSPLLNPGVSNIADDVPLEQRGSINNVGNGIGNASFGTQGDAALALGRFERANQEREKMVQVSRRGSIGEGGGRLTVVRDSSREPSTAELQNAKLAGRQAQADALRTQTQQGIMAGADQLMTSQLNRQKTKQEIDAGTVAQESAQRIAELRAKIADVGLPQNQRLAAEQAYNALTLSAADRYMTVQGGTNEGGGKDASKVFDRLTGQEIGGNQNAPARTSVPMSEVEATAKARGMTADEVVAALKEKGVSVAR